jgi:hypothetical protein
MAITHEWNGTVLTITSDSGTSSMDLKGERGNKGCRGAQGRAGVILKPDGTIDTTGYATEEYVDNAVENILDANIDLTDYVKKSELPDVSGFVTMAQVEAKGYLTEAEVLDLIQANIPASGDEVSY